MKTRMDVQISSVEWLKLVMCWTRVLPNINKDYVKWRALIFVTPSFKSIDGSQFSKVDKSWRSSVYRDGVSLSLWSTMDLTTMNNQLIRHDSHCFSNYRDRRHDWLQGLGYGHQFITYVTIAILFVWMKTQEFKNCYVPRSHWEGHWENKKIQNITIRFVYSLGRFDRVSSFPNLQRVEAVCRILTR